MTQYVNEDKFRKSLITVQDNIDKNKDQLEKQDNVVIVKLSNNSPELIDKLTNMIAKAEKK